MLHFSDKIAIFAVESSIISEFLVYITVVATKVSIDLKDLASKVKLSCKNEILNNWDLSGASYSF